MVTVTVADGGVIGLTARVASTGIDLELRSWCHGRGRLPPGTATRSSERRQSIDRAPRRGRPPCGLAAPDRPRADLLEAAKQNSAQVGGGGGGGELEYQKRPQKNR